MRAEGGQKPRRAVRPPYQAPQVKQVGATHSAVDCPQQPPSCACTRPPGAWPATVQWLTTTTRFVQPNPRCVNQPPNLLELEPSEAGATVKEPPSLGLQLVVKLDVPLVPQQLQESCRVEEQVDRRPCAAEGWQAGPFQLSRETRVRGSCGSASSTEAQVDRRARRSAGSMLAAQQPRDRRGGHPYPCSCRQAAAAMVALPAQPRHAHVCSCGSSCPHYGTGWRAGPVGAAWHHSWLNDQTYWQCRPTRCGRPSNHLTRQPLKRVGLQQKRRTQR